MARGSYSAGKRQREADKARKKRDKAERRSQRRVNGPSEDMLTTVEEMMGDLPTIDEAMEAMQQRAQAPRRAASIPCRLFVGSLSWNTTEDSLKEAFGQFGPVSDVVIVNDRDTGRSRGFGFVTMENRKDAVKAMDELNDAELDGREIVVNVATERQR
jgi:RNA recognition motif-containing protein